MPSPLPQAKVRTLAQANFPMGGRLPDAANAPTPHGAFGGFYAARCLRPQNKK